ncbi:MAG: 5'/3'-nucleotidase SurE [Acidimicrobiales bacterium]|nr:5'/3'-nucleotidase SurE [Acidimicrobiales bacterium]
MADDRPLLLLTNDDGIDSVGLHVLARAMRTHGDVLLVAPDSEYSGAGAALGALHLIRPEVHETAVEGIDRAYAVSGPPALCTMFAALGAFGRVPDLVVSGINPGANVGRAVYHSGTVGAALTARGRGISGIAVSQEVAELAVEGQGGEESLGSQRWEDAAAIASIVVEALLRDGLPADPVVVNLNVPNRAVADMVGWQWCDVAVRPPRTMASAVLTPKAGHAGTYHVEMSWGDPVQLPADTDAGAVEAGLVAVSFLSRLVHAPAPEVGAGISAALGALIG